MDSYRLLLFLHVAVVIVALGSTFAMPFLQAWGEKRGVAGTRMALEFSHHLEKILVIPGAVVIALFGVGLIFDDHTGYKDDFPGWLMAAIAWFLVAFVVGGVVQRKNVDAALATLEGASDGPTLPAAYDGVAVRVRLTGAFLALSTIGIALLMVWKPGQ